MPDYRSLDEYLVAIGFNVDYVSQRKFHDAVNRTQAVVEKFTAGAVEGFLGLGTAFVAATASVAGATVGLLHNVAQQDLGFQMYARRMMMSTDAARKMKMATDALGVSLEEIIWGPPELAERYHQLIKDQTEMMKMLGGDQGEKAFRKIRDIEFQFTRLTPALRIFGMKLVEDIINKFAGSPESLEERLKHFVDWFESPDGFVKIADYLSGKIVPFLKEVGGLIEKIFTQKNIDWFINVTGKGVEFLTKVIDFFQNNPWAVRAFGYGMAGGAIGSVIPGVGTATGAAIGAVGGAVSSFTEPAWKKFSSDWTQAANQGQFKMMALQAAAKHHIDPFLLMGLFSTESGTKWGWNPNAYNKATGAAGIAQFMPGTAKQLGINPYDPEQAIEGAAGYLEGLISQYGVSGALKRYGGFVTKDSSGYEAEIRRRADMYRQGYRGTDTMGQFQPQSFHVDGVNVYLQGTNFTEDQARKLVEDGIERAHKKIARQMYARAQGAYA